MLEEYMLIREQDVGGLILKEKVSGSTSLEYIKGLYNRLSKVSTEFVYKIYKRSVYEWTEIKRDT